MNYAEDLWSETKALHKREPKNFLAGKVFRPPFPKKVASIQRGAALVAHRNGRNPPSRNPLPTRFVECKSKQLAACLPKDGVWGLQKQKIYAIIERIETKKR
jgi:hypothetical protein